MLKIKWTDRITIDGVFQREKEERLLLKILKNRRQSWKVNNLEGAIFGKKYPWEDLDYNTQNKLPETRELTVKEQ